MRICGRLRLQLVCSDLRGPRLQKVCAESNGRRLHKVCYDQLHTRYVVVLVSRRILGSPGNQNVLTSRGWSKTSTVVISEDLYLQITYSATINQWFKWELHSDFSEIKRCSFEDFSLGTIVRLPDADTVIIPALAWCLEIFVRSEIFAKHFQALISMSSLYCCLDLGPQPKRRFCYRRVVKTQNPILVRPWAAAPLQRVAYQWVSWRGRFHSSQFITTFFPPAIMECRLCLSALRSSSSLDLYIRNVTRHSVGPTHFC